MSLIASLVLLVLAVLPLSARAWNIPGHMLSGAIAYQVLQQENPPIIEKVKAVLEKHPWYGNQWQARFQDVSVADHGLGVVHAGGSMIFGEVTINTTGRPWQRRRLQAPSRAPE